MFKNSRWLSRPEFLWKDESHLPTNTVNPPVTSSDPEVRKPHLIYVTTIKEHLLDLLIQWYSSWWKLKRGVAWLLRFKELLMKRARKKDPLSCMTNKIESELKDLKVSELLKAERMILCHV